MAIDPNKRKLTVTRKPQLTTTNTEEGVDMETSSLPPSNRKYNPMLGKIGLVVLGILIIIVVLVVVKYSTSKDSSGDVEQSGEPQGNVSTPVDNNSDKPWLNAGNNPPTKTEPPVVEKPIDSTDKPVDPDKVTLPVIKDTSLDSDKVVLPGIKDISGDTVSSNKTPVGEETFVQDLNGKDINEFYDIDHIYNTIDFISYEKKRAVTGEGVELYWLDAEYKGKKAIVQVPFKIFKELDPIGVTVVDVEVVVVKNEDRTKSEVVTGFTVKPEYKKILEKSR